MKPELELELSISESMLKYFKIYDNPHATKEDTTLAIASAGMTLGHALGVLVSTLDVESAEIALNSIVKYALEVRNDVLTKEKK